MSNPKELLLTYMLTPEEHLIFSQITGKYPAAMNEHETEVWKMLRDLSQMRREIQIKEHALVDLVNPRVSHSTQVSNLQYAIRKSS